MIEALQIRMLVQQFQEEKRGFCRFGDTPFILGKRIDAVAKQLGRFFLAYFLWWREQDKVNQDKEGGFNFLEKLHIWL